MIHLKTYKLFENNSKLNIDIIVESYIDTLLWTEEHENFDIDMKDALDTIKSEIEYFVHVSEKYLSDLDEKQIGHNFWLTRAGHGTGFWDLNYVNDDDKLILTKISDLFGGVDVSFDNDTLYYYPHKEISVFDYVYFNDIKSMNDFIMKGGDINIVDLANESLLFKNNELDSNNLDMKCLLIDNDIDLSIQNKHGNYFDSECFDSDLKELKKKYPEKMAHLEKIKKTKEFNL